MHPQTIIPNPEGVRGEQIITIMKKILLTLLLTIITLFIYADYPNVYGVPGIYDTYITTFGKFDMKDIKLFFEPADEAISPGNLEFQEYTTYVAAYFVMWGAKRVDNIKDADMFVLVDYGIGETKPLVYHNPIYGRTGVNSQRTTYYKNSSYTSYSYSHGVVGYTTEEVEQFRKYINLYVYEKSETDDPKPVWQANIVCTSKSSNLAKAIPVMMWNARYQMGGNTKDNRQFPVKYGSGEWADNLNYNNFSYYISKGWTNPWHGLGYNWTFWNKTDKTQIYPSVLYNWDTSTDIIFYCPFNEYKGKNLYLKLPSDTYIEFQGNKYKAKQIFGIEFDKKVINGIQPTFVIRFERVPDEAIRQKISIYSDVKGKRKYGWENIYVY